MFIVDNETMKANSMPYYTEATADPSWMMENLMEANDAYHEICMKMVKLEHTAIVNESNVLLEEGEKSFKEKAANVAKTVLQKFLAFLQRVQEEWAKLKATILDKLIDRNSLKEIMQRVEPANVEGTFKVGLMAKATACYKAVVSSYTGGDGIEAMMKVINDNASAAESEPETKINASSHLRPASEFLAKAADRIKSLQTIRSIATRAFRSDESAEKSSKELLIAQYSRAVSKAVSMINKATAAAVKVIRACKKSIKGDKSGYKAAKSDINAKNKANKATANELKKSGFGFQASESTSLLDLF